MPAYELTYIVRPDLDETALAAAADRILGQIRSAGGDLVTRKTMGRRRLAYPIRNYTEGIFEFLLISLPPSAIPGLERNLALNDAVLRHLVVRVEEVPSPAPEEAAPASAPAQAQTEPTPEALQPPSS